MILAFSVAQTLRSASRAKGGTAITEFESVSGVMVAVFILMNRRLRGSRTVLKKIEIAAFVGLRHMVDI